MKIRIKFIISFMLLFSMLILTLPGIGLYLAPSGKIARLSNRTFLFRDKFTLTEIHTYSGFVYNFLKLTFF